MVTIFGKHISFLERFIKVELSIDHVITRKTIKL